MIAELPGEKEPEFLLTIPFTPRNKQNLIGMMVARCDGEHLGEIVYLQLPKQEVISGPLQVEALINQDQNISKDLTLWNQQGSQVLRSQILTLPIDQTFLYVAPIYIQAAQARMPQLKKVALVQGNTLIYADTYEQALAQLQAAQGGKTPSDDFGRRTSPTWNLSGIAVERRRRDNTASGIRTTERRTRSAHRRDSHASAALSRIVGAGEMGGGGQGAGGGRGGRPEVATNGTTRIQPFRVNAASR